MANSGKVNQYLSMPFNDPMLQHSEQQGNGSSAAVGFLSPTSMSGSEQHIKSMHPSGPPPNSIAMSTLIDFIVSKTYHELTVMAEILPSKTDLERKTAIVDFSSRTRQMFIRLLSLVKWASSVGKVARCSDISTFLDRQAMHFVDAADKLHILANQLVVQARLPNFSIPAAVDILTTGTYPRLPLCIRDRLIPSDPIKPKEKNATLKRLNQIILYRLVTEYIPTQIVDVTVEKGYVMLHVPNEFKVYITLMGDGPEIPWRVLKLQFLVEDLDVGNGRSLVHDLQIKYLHELVQSRLFVNEKPLSDMFKLLHSFSLSLQLEVLFAQASRLILMRWGKFIHIDEYTPSSKLVVSYWRSSSNKSQEAPCSITIQQSVQDPSKPLEISHSPNLDTSSNPDILKSCFHINNLSLEYLIHHSISARSFCLLNQIKEMLYKHIRHDASYFLHDESDQRAVLFIPLLDGWDVTECLRLLVDPQTGSLIPSLNGVSDSMIDKMEKEINISHSSLIQWFHKLRAVLAKLRCKRAVQHLPVLCLDQLHLQKSSDFNENCLFIKFLRYPSYYLVVDIKPFSHKPTAVVYEYSLVETCLENVGTKKHGEHNPGNAVLNLKSVNKLDPKMTTASYRATTNDQHSSLPYVNTELIQMVATCSSRIPFISLIDGLEARGIEHQGLQEEGVGLEMVCHFLGLPKPAALHPDVALLIQNALIQCSFRLTIRNNGKLWLVEYVLKDPPLRGYMDKDNGKTVLVFSLYDAFTFTHTMPQKNIFTSFLQDWAAVGFLYGPVVVFAERLQRPDFTLAQRIRVQSYNYKSITIQYGQDFCFCVTINWSQDKKFILRFGRSSKKYNCNAHVLIKHYLTQSFNADPDISKLMQLLVDTCSPLQTLSQLPCCPLPGVQAQKSPPDVLFALVPQTCTRLRLFFLNTYCLDIYCREDERVMVRDGAFSQFDFAKVKNFVIPTPGLAKFFSNFKDASDYRIFSDVEKDNPSSPVSNQQTVNQASSLRDLSQVASYSGANFTVILHSSLQTVVVAVASLIRPAFNQKNMFSVLEQFFSAALSRRFLNKCIVATENVNDIPIQQNADGADASLASAFVTRSLQFVCQPHPQDMRRLVMKVNSAAVSQNMDNWVNEDLQILEKFFEVRVTCSPYRFGAMKSFFNIISAPSPILKDLIQLIKIEMLGSRSPQFYPKWNMSLCLTSPPTQSIASVGEACIMIKDKVLIFVQFSPNAAHTIPGAPPLLVIPLLYEPTKQVIVVLNVALQKNTSATQDLQNINMLLNRMAEVKRQGGAVDMSMSGAVRHLMESHVVSGMTS